MRTHGLASTYKAWPGGCRCGPCTDANAASQRGYRARRRVIMGLPPRTRRVAPPRPQREFPFRCGVCGKGMDGHPEGGSGHPYHTDAELAETKLAVDLAAKVLTVDVLLWMAREAAA